MSTLTAATATTAVRPGTQAPHTPRNADPVQLTDTDRAELRRWQHTDPAVECFLCGEKSDEHDCDEWGVCSYCRGLDPLA